MAGFPEGQTEIASYHRAHAVESIIAIHIEPHPAKADIANYRLKEEEGGYPVWAIIGDLTPGILSAKRSSANSASRWKRSMLCWPFMRATKK